MWSISFSLTQCNLYGQTFVTWRGGALGSSGFIHQTGFHICVITITKRCHWAIVFNFITISKINKKKREGPSSDFDQKNLPRLFSGQSFCLIIQRARVQNPAEAECFSLILRDLTTLK
uniref:Uncharacterized protein n=1 Tax=Cacopsylla melanoneura TaxID=428564 RepID=A0A8D8TNB8_9HEMI